MTKVKVLIAIIICILFFSLSDSSAEEKDLNTPDGFIQQAMSLIEQQKYNEADDLLLKNYPSNEENIDVNFLLGQSAFEQQKYEKSIEYYSIALKKNPELQRVHYEIAKAYAANGNTEKARKEFQIVLSTNPPPEVGNVIRKYLESLTEEVLKGAEEPKAVAEAVVEKRWSARVSLSYMYDSNINAGPRASSVLIYGQLTELSADTMKKSDSSGLLSVYAAYTLPISQTFAWDSDLSVNHTGYFRYPEFNTDQVSVSTGPSFKKERLFLSLPVVYDYLAVGLDPIKNHYSNSIGASPQLQYTFTQNLTFSSNAAFQSRKYIQNTDRDGSIISINASVRYIIGDSAYIQPGYSYAKTDTNKAYFDNMQNSANLGLYLSLPYESSLFIQPSVSWVRYRGKEESYDSVRDDREYMGSASMSKNFGRSGWNCTVRYTYIRNESNLPMYDYERNQIVAQIVKGF
ncbi:MAG: DUF560 domain-containing protein [Nitrospinae bacterium]|nr:DUF560 domain-containing protein [Nitrospinota bacterium]